MGKAKIPLSRFGQDKGNRLAQAMEEQLAPLIGDKTVIAVHLAFLYEADGQMLGGAIALGETGAVAFLQRTAGARYAGDLPSAIRTVRPFEQPKKS
jgi:hypothetical protein